MDEVSLEKEKIKWKIHERKIKERREINRIRMKEIETETENE